MHHVVEKTNLLIVAATLSALLITAGVSEHRNLRSRQPVLNRAGQIFRCPSKRWTPTGRPTQRFSSRQSRGLWTAMA